MPSIVVHVVSRLDRGGAETVALDLVRAIDPTIVEQHFVCLGGAEGVLANRFRAAGAQVHVLPLSPVWRFVPRFRRLLHAVAADVCLSHVSLASVLPLAVARSVGVSKRSARFHSDGDGRSETGPRRAYREIARRALPYVATDVTAVSQAALDFGLASRAVRRGQIAAVVPNGVDTAAFHPGKLKAAAATTRILHVGRPAPEKNRRALVPLALELATRGQYEVRAVGSDSVEDLDLPLPNNLRLVGQSDSVPDEMRHAQALVLPSLREGLPGVILEALASCLPVVASDLATIRELAIRLPGIILVDVAAPISAWADACERACGIDDFARRSFREAVLTSPYTLKDSALFWTEQWTQ